MSEEGHPFIASEDEEESYQPDISDHSSVILLTVCIFCTLSSLYVCCRVLSIGTNTASSKLIVYLTLTQANLNFAKTPFLFNQFSYGCHVSGILFFYSYFQIYIITYYMLSCAYTLLLERSKEPGVGEDRLTLSDYALSSQKKYVILILPILALVFPLATDVFEEKFNWCGINPDSEFGFFVFAQYLGLFAIVSFLQLYQLYKIFIELHSLSYGFSSELFFRFLNGPFLYSFTSFTIMLGSSIFIFTQVDGDDMSRAEYYHQYAIIIAMYIPGSLFFFIFCLEKNYIERIEENYDEMNMFAEAFNDDRDYSTSFRFTQSSSGYDSSLSQQNLKSTLLEW